MPTAKNVDPEDELPDFAPDLFIIPGVVMNNANLQPLDAKLYAVIYWLEHLKQGRCFASNATLAKLTNSSSSGVANSLVRLGKQGYIGALMNENNHRVGIFTRVRMTQSQDPDPYSNEEGGVTQMSNRKNNTNSENISSQTLTLTNKLYVGYLINFLIERSHYELASNDEKRAMIEVAKKKYRLTPGRRDAIMRRLADAGYAMCRKAIMGYASESFYQGDNKNKWVAKIDFIFRSYEKIEEGAAKFDAQTEEQ